MSTLFSNGCSFVVGHELKDVSRVDRFSNIVAKQLGLFDWNEAKVGGSNSRIYRTTINSILKKQTYTEIRKNVRVKDMNFKNGAVVTVADNRLATGEEKPTLAVIVWTGINRIEHFGACAENTVYNGKFPYHWKNGTWKSFAFDRKTLLPTLKSEVSWSPWSHPSFREIGTNYMKSRNILWCLKDTINNMLAVKYFLESQEIPQLHYVFSSRHYKPLLYLLDTKVYEAANVMWEALDLNKEEVLRELPFLKQEGFLEMAQRLNLPIGAKGHPLEEAHEIMAGRILEDYDKINTQNN